MELFDELVDQWLSAQRSVNTRSAYQRDLECLREWFVAAGRSPLGATTADIDAFRRSCEAAGSSSATVGRRLAAVSSFFRYAGSPHRVGPNPVAAAGRPDRSAKSLTAQLTTAQTDAVWQAAQRLGPKTSTLVGLVLFDGFKVGEILVLDIIDLGSGRRPNIVRVVRRGRREIVVLDGRTVTAVAAYCKGRTRGPLLLGENPTRESARLTRFGVDYLIKKAGRVAGLTAPLTANSLRRTHIVHAHASGVRLDAVRNAVGHVSSRTTLRYLPETGDD